MFFIRMQGACVLCLDPAQLDGAGGVGAVSRFQLQAAGEGLPLHGPPPPH